MKCESIDQTIKMQVIKRASQLTKLEWNVEYSKQETEIWHQ